MPNKEQYLTFILDDEEYGIDILKVKEIKGWSPATVIPRAPNYVKGVINVRGEIIPIIDLRLKFNLQTQAYGPMTVVIIVSVATKSGEKTMGIVVDKVSDIFNLSNYPISKEPDSIKERNGSFIDGLVDIENKVLILLDLDKLLDLDTITIVDKYPALKVANG